MKVLLFRALNLIASRCNKYVGYYQKEGIDFTAVGWDRTNSGIKKENYDFFRYSATARTGGGKAAINHLHWMRFIYKYLKQHPETTTIHACDLNSALPAVIYKKLHNRNLVIIFDACDWFSANMATGKITKWLFECLEKYTYKGADKLIICEPEREEQITFRLKEPPLVLPNIPEIDENLISEHKGKYLFNNGWFTIAYFGGLSHDRFLIELFELSKTEHFNLLIGGFGNKQVEELCEEIGELDNVKYFGRMNMVDGLQMTNCADIIYAMYSKINPNHIYAAPNKYYEAMFLGKPIISTKGTILEKKIVDNKIGYVIEEDVEELRNLIRTLKKEDIIKYGENAHVLWQTKYKDYVKNFFENQYKYLIK